MHELLILCLGSASLSYFLDMCFEENMIFHWYYKLIERLPEYLFKPLGGCIYCFGSWIFLILYTCLIAKFSGLIVLGIGFNYVFIKALEKYVV